MPLSLVPPSQINSKQVVLPLPSLRLITAGEKSDSFTDRQVLLMKGTLKGCECQHGQMMKAACV